MSLYKIFSLVFICIVIVYITSCLIRTDEDTPTTQSSIADCFNQFVKNTNPEAIAVQERLYGEWLLDKDINQNSILFNPNGRYYIFNGKVILQTGMFKVIKNKTIYSIITSDNNIYVDGIITICNPDMFNETTNTIWFRLCDCYI